MKSSTFSSQYRLHGDYSSRPMRLLLQLEVLSFDVRVADGDLVSATSVDPVACPGTFLRCDRIGLVQKSN